MTHRPLAFTILSASTLLLAACAAPKVEPPSAVAGGEPAAN